MPWKILRWVETPMAEEDLAKTLPTGGGYAIDDMDRPVLLFPTEWSFKYYKELNPTVVLVDSPAIK
jgi:peptide chain release factor 3